MTYMLPGEIPDMVLYQEDECQYDLMTLENSRLAVQGTVPMRLQVLLPNPEVMDMEQQVVEQIVCNSVSKTLLLLGGSTLSKHTK